MFCPTCGNQNPDDARYCTACGQEVAQSPVDPRPPAGAYSPPAPQPLSGVYSAPPGDPPEHIPNYLVWAILATICCCLPTGIVSIVYAAQVNGKVARGDLEGARQSSNNAKTWAMVSLGLGILVWVINVIRFA